MNDRQMQIAGAATALILEKGIGVSTAAIAKAAGVSNGTLFNAFATKQKLLDGIYLAAKTAMFAALPDVSGTALTRAAMRRNWTAYLNWARDQPEQRRIMHLVLEAGLVSAAAQREVEAMGAAQSAWIAKALDDGVIRGPSLDYVVRLIFFHLDLVLDMALSGAEEDLAFDMLCNAIGLTT